jgi:hypothetical protein
VLGFLEKSREILELRFYPEKAKEIGFMETLGIEKEREEYAMYLWDASVRK